MDGQLSRTGAERFLALVRSGPPANLALRVFVHAECQDTGYILRTDEHGRTWGKRCQLCLMRDKSNLAKPVETPFDSFTQNRRDDAGIPF